MNVYLLLACLSTGLALYLGCIVTTKEGFFYASVALLVVAVVQALCIVSLRTPEPPPEPIPAPTPVVAFSLDFSALETLYDAYKIDSYLARKGSPMSGTGLTWLKASRDSGIPVSLALAISGQESSFGKVCFRPFNAGGIHGFTGTDWNDYVYRQFEVISQWGKPTLPGELRGYCEGTPQSWLTAVGYFQSEIQGRGIK